MRHLNIDIETYSSNDIKNGVYKYADAEDFEILLFAYSIDGGEVECLDLTRQSLPEDIKDMLFDDKVRKHAFNAQFERVCLSRYLGLPYYLDPCQWQCTMVLAQELGLPSSLEKCALYLKLVQEKDTSGKNLIRYFSLPCKPSKANGGRTRNLPEHAPEKWQMFIDYCIQDVVVEMAIAEKLESVPVHDREWGYYACDQRINDRGVALDKELVASALYCKDVKMKSLSGELKAITGLDNPNSRAQLLPWLKEHGYSVNGLTKADVEQELKTAEGELKRVLELKLQTAMSSLKKYEERAMCSDGRVHGLLQFYGASRTGRWAGRVVQVQNLARNYIKDLDDAREYVKKRDIDAVEILYDSLNDTLKQLVRTALVAKDCCTFYVSDFSAIEARVIAWFAGEQWRLDVFSTHGKIYEASASQMFGIPIEEIDKELRQKGKISELALGYQGGPGALKQMGALNMGVKEEELQGLVDDWRRANKKIVQFWKDVQRAAIKAIKSRAPIKLGKLRFRYRKGFLFITLPSGRNLAYARAKVEPGDYGDKIVYEGQGDKAYFTAQETYGGKLVENIVQATARDILAEALLRIEAAGYGVVFHVHDEAIIEGSGLTIEEVNDLMAQTPEWAEGLPLNSEGYITKYYMKD
ncbi:TPA: DNA polymerase [Streptococcus pyogenes]